MEKEKTYHTNKEQQKPLVIIAISMFILVLITSFTAFFLNHKGEKYSFNFSSQTVIKQIQSLNRLETSTYTIEKVIDAGTSGNKFQQFLYGDRILLIAHGQVIAGIDMSKVQASDVNSLHKTLKVKLPAPEILVTNLDNDQTRVYDRQQGLLTKGDDQLESEARKEAEKVIRDAACKGGILQEASKNARNQLTTLFKSFGYTTVIIDIPDGSC